MKKTLRKSLRQHKRNLENLHEMVSGFDYTQIKLHQEQYLRNLMATNKMLLKDFNIDNLILF